VAEKHSLTKKKVRRVGSSVDIVDEEKGDENLILLTAAQILGHKVKRKKGELDRWARRLDRRVLRLSLSREGEGEKRELADELTTSTPCQKRGGDYPRQVFGS